MKKRRKSDYPNVDVPGSPEYDAFKEALKEIVQTPKKVVDEKHTDWKTAKLPKQD